MLELPYFDEKASMIILLPENQKLFSQLQKDISMDYAYSMMDSLNYQNINLSIPKFRIEYKADLAKLFFSIGMKMPFTNDADFHDMVCDEDVKIDKIIHQTFIEIDESGTEAAAATAVVMSRVTSINPNETIEFNANKPFIFFIKENTTGSILFMGHLVK